MTTPPDTTADLEALAALRRRCDLSFPYAVRAVVSLGIAELLRDGPVSTEGLAATTGTQRRPLVKVLARVAAEGYLARADDRWSLTETGKILTDAHVRGVLDNNSGHARLDAGWPGLLHTLRTGQSGYQHVVGQTYWDSVALDPVLGSTFDIGLSLWAARWSGALTQLIGADFDGHIVDVGGGVGRVLADALAGCPSATGTLVELPTTVQRAQRLVTEQGLGDRVTYSEQSFFEPLPTGGQIYLLTQVLHDWPDDESRQILHRLAEVVGTGRILIVERIHDGTPGPDEAAFDLMMNVVFAGGERSLDEYQRLAGAEGLQLVACTDLIEGVAALEFRSA